MIFCVMDCFIFSVALLVVKRLTGFPVHCVVHLGEMCSYMLTINIQIDYRVVHRLVFISALLVMASMMNAYANCNPHLKTHSSFYTAEYLYLDLKEEKNWFNRLVSLLAGPMHR